MTATPSKGKAMLIDTNVLRRIMSEGDRVTPNAIGDLCDVHDTLARRVAELEAECAAPAKLLAVAQKLEAENARLVEALRACRRATLHGADEPRSTVRQIVDDALEASHVG